MTIYNHGFQAPQPLPSGVLVSLGPRDTRLYMRDPHLFVILAFQVSVEAVFGHSNRIHDVLTHVVAGIIAHS